METDKQPERFAGQALLAMDTRSERPLRKCPACSSNKSNKLGIKNELEVVSCSDCRTLYCPYMPWYTSEQYYGNYYEDRFCEEPPIVIQRLKEITAEFSPYRQTNQLLDVGCGAGVLLQAAREHGWEARGIDVSESSVKHVRTLGLDAFHGELKDAPFKPGQFDVITAAEILEHLFDPLTVVREVHRLLRPGGLFWLTTPHVLSLTARVRRLDWRAIAPPEHLQLFSVEGMRRMLLEAGFQNVRFETTGTDPGELSRAIRKQKLVTQQQTQEAMVTKYRLNEAMSTSNSRRVLKNAANHMLNLLKLGDSLKAYAIR